MKIFILFLFFILLIVKIYAIGGADNEEYDADNNEENEVDLTKTCPCDINKDSCDFGCCCDSDCLPYMFDQNYMKLFEECDKSSSFSKNLNNRLDYCDEYQKSLDDLYNPLILAFKVLKRGFCLEKGLESTSNDNNYDIDDDEEKEQIGGEDEFEKYEPKENEAKNFGFNSVEDFSNMEFNVPISLPNGMCFFGHFQVKKLQDYEVTCSYLKSKSDDIVNYYTAQNSSPTNYFVKDNYYYDDSPFENRIIKKIEIIYHNDSLTINHYFVENDDQTFGDLTLEVKFLAHLSDYPRSGSPGYIKGKPLLIKNEIDKNYTIYKILPIDREEDENDCKSQLDTNNYYYFDNYLDNILTFEDFIIYGYNKKNCFGLNKFDGDFGIFGSASLNVNSDWKEISQKNEESNNDIQNKLLIGVYRYSGEVNNPQNQIYELEYIKRYITNSEGKKKYIVMKFIKPKKMETKWEYAPGPGFIRLPKNIMYPFKIGTTKYSEK